MARDKIKLDHPAAADELENRISGLKFAYLRLLHNSNIVKSWHSFSSLLVRLLRPCLSFLSAESTVYVPVPGLRTLHTQNSKLFAEFELGYEPKFRDLIHDVMNIKNLTMMQSRKHLGLLGQKRIISSETLAQKTFILYMYLHEYGQRVTVESVVQNLDWSFKQGYIANI